MAEHASDSAIADETDRRFMAASIRLSHYHLGLTGENPSVGALVVRDDGNGPRIVGRGVTAPGGRPHAELQALAEAGELARGATVYSTLEPCSHVGRAPPCSEALVAAGVARVVIAVLDPDPRVTGRGAGILERAGVEVVRHCLETEARRAMAGFLSLKGRGRPYLTLKLAVSEDCAIGRKEAGQVSITGPLARSVVQAQRAEHEAIMVGVGTAVADDPSLTVRLPGFEGKGPTRIVIDPFARLPVTSRMLTDGAGQVLVVTTARASKHAVAALAAKGAETKTLYSDHRGRIVPAEILRLLGVLGIKSVYLEGGADTARRFLEAGLVDRLLLFKGSVTVGADGVPSPVNEDTIPADFAKIGEARYEDDRLIEFEREA